jgi:hypothetical protein
MPFYGDIFRENFFDLKNSKNRQNNGDLKKNKKIINLLTVTVLFLFTFFTLILDAPRTSAQKRDKNT